LRIIIIKPTLLLLAFVLIVNYSIFVPNYHIVFSQNSENNINKNNIYSRITESNDLNITMRFDPQIPNIYQQTKILFQINHLNGSEYIKNVTSIVTIIDSNGGLYKFDKQEVHNGKISINYIFQNIVKNKIIIQLYKDNQGFALASFDIQLPNSAHSTNNNSSNFFSDVFKSISDLFKNVFK
jgi:hypothetical protein